jgi:hypothetical protein
MKKSVLLTSGALLISAWLLAPMPGQRLTGVAALPQEGVAALPQEGADPQEDAKKSPPVAASGAVIAKHVEAVLAGLDEEQKKKASFKYEDEERYNWHFIPRPRKGVSLREMNKEQKAAVTALLRVSLSKVGVKTVHQVRSLEAILAEIEGPNRRFPRDPQLYFVSVFGKPAEKGKWAWRFEGHHLCLNFALDGHKLTASTPLFFGANPAEVMSGPKKGLRVLGSVEDLARQLVTGLNEEQKAVAIGTEKPTEVEATQSPTYNADLPKGLAINKLDKEQKKLFRKLLGQHIKHLDDGTKKRIRKEFLAKGKLAKIQFVWRGGTKPGEGHSYLLHSPDFVVSFANFQNDAKHVHSGFRALKSEFGLPAKK